MGLAHIPTSNSCLLCHESGGSSGVKPIPAIGHPLEGWGACLTCHTDEKLGQDGSGSRGHRPDASASTATRWPQDGPAITQAHAQLDKPCLDCHGSVAHLPSSMVGRNQDECWLCHKPNPSPPPTKPHPDPANLTCRACHQSADAGAPADRPRAPRGLDLRALPRHQGSGAFAGAVAGAVAEPDRGRLLTETAPSPRQIRISGSQSMTWSLGMSAPYPGT